MEKRGLVVTGIVKDWAHDIRRTGVVGRKGKWLGPMETGRRVGLSRFEERWA